MEQNIKNIIEEISGKMFMKLNTIPETYFYGKKKDEEYELIIEIYGMIKEFQDYVSENASAEIISVTERIQHIVSDIKIKTTHITDIGKYKEIHSLLKSVMHE